MADLLSPAVAINDQSFIRGAARLLVAGITITFPSTLGAIVNMTQFNAMTNWTDLGATKTGIQISVNNTEETFDVDQVYADISSAPTAWQCSVTTALAEVTLQRLQVAWEGSVITTATEDGNSVSTMGIGQPTAYTQRMLAVLFQRPSGKLRGYIFRKVSRAPQESTITHAKTGEQQSIPVRFNAFADTSVSDIYQRFFLIKDTN